MNHAGEIAPLVAIARPQIAIITNVGSAHIEFLGSREAIAREKASIAANLTAEELLILPHNCDFLPLIRSLTAARIITTGGADDHVRAENIRDEDGHACFTLMIGADLHADIRLGVAGKHMVANALLAVAAADALTIPLDKIVAGLHQASLTSGRLRRFVTNQITVFDDTYNANPESIIAGLETLAQQPIAENSLHYAVLGRMAELGEHAEAAARRVGQHAAKLGITTIAVGDGAELIASSAGDRAKHFPTREAAADYLQQVIHPGDAVLFKGSRTSAMELVMKQLFPNN
jgi:UDP-N-acetylmuramoyl-tripeptide--D-alanyl-D-alanine ligase